MTVVVANGLLDEMFSVCRLMSCAVCNAYEVLRAI
jgi:hypothetical protein